MLLKHCVFKLALTLLTYEPIYCLKTLLLNFLHCVLLLHMLLFFTRDRLPKLNCAEGRAFDLELEVLADVDEASQPSSCSRGALAALMWQVCRYRPTQRLLRPTL